MRVGIRSILILFSFFFFFPFFCYVIPNFWQIKMLHSLSVFQISNVTRIFIVRYTNHIRVAIFCGRVLQYFVEVCCSGLSFKGLALFSNIRIFIVRYTH